MFAGFHPPQKFATIEKSAAIGHNSPSSDCKHTLNQYFLFRVDMKEATCSRSINPFSTISFDYKWKKGSTEM